jgi:hypothetical protein
MPNPKTAGSANCRPGRKKPPLDSAPTDSNFLYSEKENEVLFVITARNLPPEKLAELKEGFDRIESRRIGAGKHEAFHRTLERLQEA